MKKIAFLAFIIFYIIHSTNAQQKLAKLHAPAFTYGEELTYKIKYSMYFNMPVGNVIFSVEEKPAKVAGKPHFHVKAQGNTAKFFDPFFKVRDRYESYMDVVDLTPSKAVRVLREGGYKKDEYLTFDKEQQQVTNVRKEVSYDIPQETFDMLGAIYYVRNFDFESAQPGDSLTLNTFISDTTYLVGLRYLSKSKMKTAFGKVECLEIEPILIVGRVFKTDNPMKLWVTADKNKVPVRIESGISVGAIVAELTDYKGLKYTSFQ